MISLQVSPEQAALINKLCRKHVEDLGERQQKPKGYTYNQVISELEAAVHLVSATEEK